MSIEHKSIQIDPEVMDQLIDKASYVQLGTFVEKAQARMQHLRDEGLQSLSDRFETMSQTEVGLSLQDLVSSLRKTRRRRRAAAE